MTVKKVNVFRFIGFSSSDFNVSELGYRGRSPAFYIESPACLLSSFLPVRARRPLETQLLGCPGRSMQVIALRMPTKPRMQARLATASALAGPNARRLETCLILLLETHARWSTT